MYVRYLIISLWKRKKKKGMQSHCKKRKIINISKKKSVGILFHLSNQRFCQEQKKPEAIINPAIQSSFHYIPIWFFTHFWVTYKQFHRKFLHAACHLSTNSILTGVASISGVQINLVSVLDVFQCISSAQMKETVSTEQCCICFYLLLAEDWAKSTKFISLRISNFI